MTDSQKLKISRLNDEFRKTAIGGIVMLTQGVQSQPPETVQRIMIAVQSFDAFTQNSDPYGEHDFGSVEVENLKLFWKIDYYDPSLVAGSEDPADPDVTKRVLTIMLREEY